MTEQDLGRLLERLVQSSHEHETLEFKSNYLEPHDLGKCLSALSNAASLLHRDYGYLVFGVEDGTHAIRGTEFSLQNQKVGSQELEHWLLRQLQPRLDMRIHEFDYHGKRMVIFIKISVKAALLHVWRFMPTALRFLTPAHPLLKQIVLLTRIGHEMRFWRTSCENLRFVRKKEVVLIRLLLLLSSINFLRPVLPLPRITQKSCFLLQCPFRRWISKIKFVLAISIVVCAMSCTNQ